jgi:uncharacterized protein YndB with AHSA1/START domain
MTKSNDLRIEKDLENKRIKVTRYFSAVLELVWRAWTESELLDQWWAPKPWKAETKKMNFTNGGQWLYAMVGPDGSKHWSRVDFKNINTGKSFEARSCFSDESGVQNNDMPTLYWKNAFTQEGKGTIVIAEISFTNEVDFETIIKMGFEGGFSMGLNNLEELIASKQLS